MLVLPFRSLQGDPDERECELNAPNTRSEKVSGVSLVRKIKSVSFFLNLLSNQRCQRCYNRPSLSGTDGC